MNSASDRLFSQTLKEVAGFYRPGGEPVILAGHSLSPKSISRHEAAHRNLCENTSFGRFTSYLATVLAEDTRLPQKSAVESLLAECIEYSWVCHEGFAVWQQMLDANVSGGSASVLLESLPKSYVEAANSYGLDLGEVTDWVTAVIGDISESKLAVSAFLEAVSNVIAYSAMCVPMVSAAGDDPLSFTAIQHIRRNSPDERLKRVVASVTKDLALGWGSAMLSVSNSDNTIEQWALEADRLAEEHCVRCNLNYESANLLIQDADRFFMNLRSQRKPVVVDNSDQQIHEKSNVCVSPLTPALVKESRLTDCCEWLRVWDQHLLDNKIVKSDSDTHVLAEIFGEHDGTSKIAFHFFVKFQGHEPGVSIKLSSPIHSQLYNLPGIDAPVILGNLRQGAALPFGTIVCDAPSGQIYEFGKLYAGSVDWLVQAVEIGGDGLGLDRQRFSKTRLLDMGRVYTVDMILGSEPTLKSNGWIDVSNSSLSATFFENLFLHKRMLDSETGIELVRVGMDKGVPNELISTENTKFPIACLVETLLFGFCAQFRRAQGTSR